jgi:hypothetical protein
MLLCEIKINSLLEGTPMPSLRRWRRCVILPVFSPLIASHFTCETYLTGPTTDGYLVEFRKGTAVVVWCENGVHTRRIIDEVAFQRSWIFGGRKMRISGGGISGATVILKERGTQTFVIVSVTGVVKHRNVENDELFLGRIRRECPSLQQISRKLDP